VKRRVLIAVFAVSVGIAALMTEGVRAGDGAAPAVATAGAETIVYYFHGNVRCTTCRTIEAYADEAVHAGFPEALANGELEWRVVNIDEPQNRHFIQDFQLVTRSVVLAEYRGGEVVRSKNLDKVWQLVRNKQRFIDYVQSETKAFLAAG
jgi:hypothetical protein